LNRFAQNKSTAAPAKAAKKPAAEEEDEVDEALAEERSKPTELC
jgi:hypothetical protein